MSLSVVEVHSQSDYCAITRHMVDASLLHCTLQCLPPRTDGFCTAQHEWRIELGDDQGKFVRVYLRHLANAGMITLGVITQRTSLTYMGLSYQEAYNWVYRPYIDNLATRWWL